MAEIGPNWNAGGWADNGPGTGGWDPNAPNGPLSALDSDPYSLEKRQYPRNVGLDPRGHYINFYINVANESSFVKQNKYSLNATVGTGTTGNNQANDAGSARTGSQTLNDIQSVFTVRQTKRISGAISLYMPETVNVQYGADWQSQSLTDAAGALGKFASISGSSATSIADQIRGSAKTASGASASWAEVAANLLESRGLVGPGAADFALFAVGYAINPQLQVLFKGTEMRQFQFDFLFSPYNAEESEAVIGIIRQFKFHQAPEVVTDTVGRFFIPPSEFDIEFKYNGQDNKKLHKIGTCVLTNMNVDYAPNGWSAFPDGTPTNIRMTLNFMETEIVTKQRVNQGY